MGTIAAESPTGAMVEQPAPKRVRLPVLSQLLDEQRDLTAVERFSQHHDDVEGPLQERFYKDLLPASPPRPGEQYAFEVDLDQCSGCKACVTACHSLNGLDEDETWRSVGLLHGGSPSAPVQQTVTTACHHCVDPGCMHGCPVGAYEKDPMTGIVRHLDDQCIGCQYCIFTCPYEVPQFNTQKGIVRKCDMCADRLEVGEAPACVQACPNEAIAIRTVNVSEVIDSAQNDSFLPGAPSPGITVPTTNYKSSKPMPANMLPADFYRVHAAHPHMPLVVFLVLTQLSVGAFIMSLILPEVLSASSWGVLAPYHGLTALLLGLMALGASTSHLGRPLYAYRAFIGVRTSWMSREIIVFGGFSAAAPLYAAALVLAHQPAWLPELALLDSLRPLAASVTRPLRWAVAAAGLLGVFCSVMLYAVTGRYWWAFPRTAYKFFMTTVVLGIATALAVMFAMFSGAPLPADVLAVGKFFALILVATTIAKLAAEAGVFVHLRDRQQGDLKRSALLLRGELARFTVGRFGFGVLGGVLIPGLGLTSLDLGSPGLAMALSFGSLAFLVAGELLERITFFGAMSAPRMPGGLG